MVLLGSNSGLSSSIDGTAGDEYPRTSPMQKYDIDTHNERIVWNANDQIRRCFAIEKFNSIKMST